MAPLPQSVLVFTDKAGLDNWYREFKDANTRLTFSDLYTNSESLCKEIHGADLTPPTGEKGAFDAELSRKLHIRLADCAPIYECAWTSCNGMVRRGLEWFELNKDKPFMDWHKNYNSLRTRLPTASEVEHYQTAALLWRKETKFAINSLTVATDTPVLKQYRVGPSIVTDLIDLLTDMKRRRNEALGIAEGEERAPAEHVELFRDWVKAKDWTVPCPWGDWTKKNKANQQLYVTAAAGCLNKRYFTKEILKRNLDKMVASMDAAKENPDYSQESLQRLRDVISSIYHSVEGFMAAQRATTGSGFVQQGSAIDTAFSSYYWAWSAGVRLETFPSLSGMLFALGKSPVGRTKIEKRLRDCPYLWAQKLIEGWSRVEGAGAIHIHPGVLTPGRMASEMVCSFGAFPVSNPARIADGASSPRFLLNMRSDGNNPAGQSISAIFREFKQAYPNWQAEAIVPVEHMLHQSFLSKMGPFVNVSQVPGQALNVNIVSIDDN